MQVARGGGRAAAAVGLVAEATRRGGPRQVRRVRAAPAQPHQRVGGVRGHARAARPLDEFGRRGSGVHERRRRLEVARVAVEGPGQGSPGEARPDDGAAATRRGGEAAPTRLSSVKLRRPSDGRRFRGRASGWGVTTGSLGRRALTGVVVLASILGCQRATGAAAPAGLLRLRGSAFAGAFPAGSGGSGRRRLEKGRGARRLRGGDLPASSRQPKVTVLSRQRFAAKGRYLNTGASLTVPHRPSPSQRAFSRIFGFGHAVQAARPSRSLRTRAARAVLGRPQQALEPPHSLIVASLGSFNAYFLAEHSQSTSSQSTATLRWQPQPGSSHGTSSRRLWNSASCTPSLVDLRRRLAPKRRASIKRQRRARSSGGSRTSRPSSRRRIIRELINSGVKQFKCATSRRGRAPGADAAAAAARARSKWS